MEAVEALFRKCWGKGEITWYMGMLEIHVPVTAQMSQGGRHTVREDTIQEPLLLSHTNINMAQNKPRETTHKLLDEEETRWMFYELEHG
jgi:hypothetical protein